MKKRSFFIGMVALIVAGLGNSACAADFSSSLSKALEEIPPGGDVAGMGGANIAVPGFSSRNPAVIGVVDESSKFGVNGTYGLINFKNGPDVNVYQASVSAKLPAGAVQLTLSDSKSNAATLVDGFSKIQFNDSPSVALQYGLPVASHVLLADDVLYLGADCSYSQSKITMIVDQAYVTESRGYSIGTGVLYRVGKTANLGVSYEHSWDSGDDFIDGTLDASNKTQTSKLRFGTSLQVIPGTMFAADYQHLYLPNGEKDDQFFAGIEQYVIKDALALYGGYANGGVTFGLGSYFKQGGINVVYVRHAYRSMDEFLGKANMFMASAYWTF